MSLLSVKKMPTSKNNLKQRMLMEKGIVPGHPKITILSGSAGSGKTSVVWNLLTNPLMYGPSYELMSDEEKEKEDPRGFFDAVFLFLGSADDAYDILIKKKIIKPQHVSIHPKPEHIQAIIDNQMKLMSEAKSDITKIPKILFIIDDLVTDARLMKSQPMLNIITRGRHINSSTILCTQYINLVPRSIRQQASFLILFKLNRVEVKVVTEQYCPPLVSTSDFQKLIDECTKDDEHSRNNFMVISKMAPLETRFRKNFDIYVIPPNTLEQPKLRRDKKLIAEEKKDEEEYEGLLDEPLEIEKVKFNVGQKEDPSSGLLIPLGQSKKKLNIPNPNGFIHPGIYNIGGRAPTH